MRFRLFVAALMFSLRLFAADDLTIIDGKLVQASSTTTKAFLKATETPPGSGKYVLTIGATVTGAGDASATNQAMQITAEQAILAKLPTLAARTPTTSANTSSGTIAAGCRQITFIASSDFVGTILTNLPLVASAGVTITAPPGDTIGAIAFTRSAGVLYTVELR